MTIRLHDTMSRGLVEVAPIEEGHVRLYTCGPTVYARAHIGNFRTFIFEDILRRWLDRSFAKVTHVMNLTDVEDKIIRNAASAGHSLDEETKPWIDGFFADLDALGIRHAHDYPRATAYIDAMIDLVDELTQRGLTYESEGSIYFRVASFPGYGKLSGVKLSELVAGASGRVDADEYDKEEARDFALWKSVGPDEIGWDTRLGRGRPGWHIECSAMSMKLLGSSIDIHCGGVDNIFPHHENEIAQSEGATGERFVNIWCHSAHLRIGGGKMAKSEGNFFTLSDVLQQPNVRPSAVRYLLAANAHYRKPLNYTSEGLEAATEAVDRFATFSERVRRLVPGELPGGPLLAQIDDAGSQFENAMNDDLNLPEAMGKVFELIRDSNRQIDFGLVGPAAKEALVGFIDMVDDVLGVLELVEREQAGDVTEQVEELLAKRNAARDAKDWSAADELRKELAEHGIAVEDTPSGQRWRRS
jgi:cysteinyl-tRNA synthetase